MYNKKLNKYGEITTTQLLIVLIAALLTWVGVDYYSKNKEGKETFEEGPIISLPQEYNDELTKLKSAYKELEKLLKEKESAIKNLETIGTNTANLKKVLQDKIQSIKKLEKEIKEKDSEIARLEASGADTDVLKERRLELEEANKIIASLSESIKSTETELKNRNMDLENASSTINQLNTTNKSLSEGLKESEEGLRTARNLISVLYKENTTFKEEKKIIGTVRKKIKESAKGYSEDTDFKFKPVVLTQYITVELSQNEVATLCGITTGNADLRVTYKDNKVQYYVDLERLSDQDVQYDMDSRSINIYIASPKIDEDMVEVQSDPDKINIKDKTSWITYGIDLEKMKVDIQKRVRKEVLEAGSHDMYKASARRNAKEKLYELFNRVLKGYLEEKNLDLNIIVYD